MSSVLRGFLKTSEDFSFGAGWRALKTLKVLETGVSEMHNYVLTEDFENCCL